MPFNADPYISKTPGFPKEDITFYDISPILEDSAVIRQAMDALTYLTRPMHSPTTLPVAMRGDSYSRYRWHSSSHAAW